MRFLPYILRHLRRNWIRSATTVIAIAVTIFLFCTLQTFLAAINFNLKSANDRRLAVRHAVSLVFNVPLTYKPRIQAMPGVKRVAVVSWFGGSQGSSGGGFDYKNFFPNLAVDGEEYLAMYPEVVAPEEQKKAWLADRRGALVGRKTAERFGWKVGDAFQLESFIPPYRIGRPFDFVVSGIYDSDPVKYPGTDLTVMLFHHKYLYEATNQNVAAGMYMVEIEDPARAGEISKTIDSTFENTDAQTRSETEAAFRAGFVAMAGNLALLLNVIGVAVTFTILLVTANTMSMAVRERRTEIAVLKTLGFPSGLVMGLVMGEALTIGALGGAVGIGLSQMIIGALPQMPLIGDAIRGFPDFGLDLRVTLQGFALALAVGFFAGFVPAMAAYRGRITEILRQV